MVGRYLDGTAFAAGRVDDVRLDSIGQLFPPYSSWQPAAASFPITNGELGTFVPSDGSARRFWRLQVLP